MLRSGNTERIQKLISQLGAEIQALVKSALELSWYSRGAWPYQTVLMMTAGERDIANDFINKRMETQAKLLHPTY